MRQWDTQYTANKDGKSKHDDRPAISTWRGRNQCPNEGGKDYGRAVVSVSTACNADARGMSITDYSSSTVLRP